MQAEVSSAADWKGGLGRFGLEPGRPLESGVDIDAAAKEVWKAIAEPGNLGSLHPFCAATEVERRPGTGSRDSITYLTTTPLSQMYATKAHT